MHSTLLIGAQEFWNSLCQDINQAEDKIYLQTMSFEGDSVGKKLADLLISSSATDKRLCVDSYSRFVINDTFLYPFSYFDRSLRKEAIETKEILKSFPSKGVQLCYTNPLGPCAIYYPARNHKKLVVIDDRICYLGGINFCEHNFQWMDMMLRIEDPQMASFLSQDFLATWQQKNQSKSASFGESQLFLLNGSHSEQEFTQITEMMGAAKRSLHVLTPYITFPFLDVLQKIADQGKEVTLIIPGKNNKPIIDYYLQYTLRHSNIKLRVLTDQMFHLKAVLIDDHSLLTGSYNYDFVGRWVQQEAMIMTKDKPVIDRFQKEVLNDFLSNSHLLEPTQSALLPGLISKKVLQIAQGVCKTVSYLKGPGKQ